jgi:hypothetical protein
MKTIAIQLAIAGLLAVTLPAKGQMIVNDPKVLAEALKQARSWKQQLDSMQTQIKSMTGDRGMSRVLGAAVPVLPADWTRAMTGISGVTQQIRAAQSVLPAGVVAKMSPELRSLLNQAQTLSASTQAMAQSAYNDAATTHRTRIATLQAQLAGMSDMKAAADLANLIAIEHASLVNDQNQINAANGAAAAQAEAQRLILDQMRVATGGTGQILKVDFSLP